MVRSSACRLNKIRLFPTGVTVHSNGFASSQDQSFPPIFPLLFPFSSTPKMTVSYGCRHPSVFISWPVRSPSLPFITSYTILDLHQRRYSTGICIYLVTQAINDLTLILVYHYVTHSTTYAMLEIYPYAKIRHETN